MSKDLGDRGEAWVADLLRSHGWKIEALQWRCRWGELDLVVSDRQWLVFVEVKTRSDRNWDIDGTLAITPQKQAKIIKAASLFLAENIEKQPYLHQLACRFDVALVRHHPRLQRGDQTHLSLEFSLQHYIEEAFLV
ncbi:MAG: YraN family protein [Pseudanabaenaceae cyanobacterium bins.39]|nr:YraN family protein [Pseudanabaenaceae cyanobacterium bins.39]